MKIKISVSIVGVVLLSMVSNTAVASPRGGSNYGRDYVVASQELQPVSAGGYYHSRERAVELKIGNRGFSTQMTVTEALGYVGYDVLPWWTVYGSIGESRAEFTSVPRDDGRLAYGIGTQFNLLDHEIEDPFILEDRIRVNAGAEYNRRRAERFDEDIRWAEVNANLTISVINDVQADKRYYPESIAVFAGPMYSGLLGDDLDADGDEFGYVFGLEIFYTKRISMYAAVEMFEDTGFSAGLNLCF